MKSKILMTGLFAILAFVLVAGLASAAVDFVTVDGDTQTVDDGSQVTVTFAMEESGHDDLTDIIFDSPITFSGCAETFDAAVAVTGAPTTLAQSATSSLITATFNIPNNQLACSYTGDLVVNGQYATAVDYELPLTITVDENPSLSVSDATIPAGEDSVTITVTNDGNVDLNGIELTDSGDFDVTLSQTTNFNLGAGETLDVTVTASNLDDLPLGTNSVTITATADGGPYIGTITLENSFCEVGNPNGNLRIKIEEITNNGILNTKFGDDTDWFPLEEIEVEIEVENRGNEKIKDIVIEWGLYDLNTGEWYIDDEENDFNLKDGDEKTITVSFKLDDDVDELEDGDYVFYVKATGDDTSGADDEEICASESEEIEVEIEDDFVVVDNIQIMESVLCGETIEISMDVWNIGSDDQEDVFVLIHNEELGITAEVMVGDIDAFRKEEISTFIFIPSNVEEKSYNLKLWVYDEDNDIYENDYDDDEAKFGIPIAVAGNCGGT